MSSFYYLSCIQCRKKTTEKETTSVCPKCGGPLDVKYDFDYLKKRVNPYVLLKTQPKAIKYLDLLPLSRHDDLVTLEEGSTPLQLANNLGKRLGLTNLFIKVEGLNPTGAFKDRGSFVEINKAKELGYQAVVVASTGNMAASVAAFAVQANLTCYVFVPETTPAGKLAQCLSYGANVIKVRGSYAQATSLAAQTATKYGYYLAGDYAFRLEGQKTLAYEIVEQSFLKPPDWVIVPIGMGTNIAAIWKGFGEYYQLGILKSLPKMVGVQAQGCQPVVEAFNRRKKVKFVDTPNTVVSAIACGYPFDAQKAISALDDSKGLGIAVTDDEILSAQQQLARFEGIYIEPAAATTVAALFKLVTTGEIKKDDRIILVSTGAGLKDPTATLKVLAEPPVIETNLSEVDRLIKGNIFSIRAAGMVDQKKVIFTSIPRRSTLVKVLQQEFGLGSESIDLDQIKSELKEFKEKGKAVTKADLQAIIETTTQQPAKRRYLEVVDFVIEDKKHQPARALVKMKINGQVFESQGDGDGPVDAAINAIRHKLTANGAIEFELRDYNVEVTSAGTDAAVVVVMVLEDKMGHQVVARQTSPDIIHASIEAFELGYNELVSKAKKHEPRNSS